MGIGIGIDTGGTCTDAVAYDFTEQKILAASKALTTKTDLSIGIVNALDRLPADLVRQAQLISLSTTLATNACVEDRVGRAKLVFLGGDALTVDRYGRNYGLPPSEDVYFQDSYTTFSGQFEKDVDWRLLADRTREFSSGLDGIGVIEMNAMRNGAAVEVQAKKILSDVTDVRVVCGHELSSELSCLERGAGTLLNASLFPVIEFFIQGVGRALERRGIKAPVVIVRSDGSMMGKEFAALRPVETLLCGPAASVIGGLELARRQDCVIVDMGGTTTDIALVNAGDPVMSPDGVAIGKWRTFVKGVYIHTFGLGGDSAVHYRDGRLFLEDYRVAPLCILASTYPEIKRQLVEDLHDHEKHTRYLHEFFVRLKDISDSPRYTDLEKRFCAALAGGPLIRRRAAAAVGRDEYTLDVERLLRDGVVQLAGLTPTDIMHIRGDFSGYDAEASRLGAEFVAMNLDLTVEELCETVYREVKKKLYVNIVETLLRNQDFEYAHGLDGEIRELIMKTFDASVRPGPALVRGLFRTEHALVGIGAPTHLFLVDVAAMLGTTAVLPEHAGVANALGAIVGKVHVRHEILIRPAYDTNGISGYVVHGDCEKQSFAERAEAEDFARVEAERSARAEALRRGVKGEITVTCDIAQELAQARDCEVYMGAKVVAQAVGSAGI